ncbi:MAG: hypothetical protein RL215_2795, partial [Planctomycetota bacterium]
MSAVKSTDIRVRSAAVEFEPVPYRAPLKFGGRIVSSGWLMNVRLTVETRSGRQAEGRGSMPCGNVWAWPSGELNPEQTEQAMLEYARRLALAITGLAEPGHPLELAEQLHGVLG